MRMRKARSAPTLQFPLREAKNRLSELVRRAARGEQIVITVHGEPRARLSQTIGTAQPFAVDKDWLRGMKVARAQTPAEESIRADRDARD
jgi:antitoxin (DNA-binding transcriptional repressor) of toxin-antitoxin stability system